MTVNDGFAQMNKPLRSAKIVQLTDVEMNQEPCRDLSRIMSIMIPRGLSRSFSEPQSRSYWFAISSLVALTIVMSGAAIPQQDISQHLAITGIQGTVHTSTGSPAVGAKVRLEDAAGVEETRSDAAGSFEFPSVKPGTYLISATNDGMRSRGVTVVQSPQRDQKKVKVDLVLIEPNAARAMNAAPSPGLAQSIEFADSPSFTIAGVTDWTAAGGHGSDSTLRTSEALARETFTLNRDDKRPSDSKATANSIESESKLRADAVRAPDSFAANSQLGEFYLHLGRYQESIPLLEKAYRIDPGNRSNEFDLAFAYKQGSDFVGAREHVQALLENEDSADLHRLSGEIDESMGDALSAVHHFEQAARMDPSEQNYFEWGSELLLHRAIWQAQEVFRKGSSSYPRSTRMLTGFGAALFAGAVYDEAALRFCAASDLNPADPDPYIFMGKTQIAAPHPLPCIEERLARFVREKPANPLANYFYAMAILKCQEQHAIDARSLQDAEALLRKAVTMDPKCADAYLELGVLAVSRHSFATAIGFYLKAIEANPQLTDAHYRLGVAYDRIGDSAKAKEEFQVHDELEKKQADAIEQARKQVKQFMVIEPDRLQPKK